MEATLIVVQLFSVLFSDSFIRVNRWFDITQMISSVMLYGFGVFETVFININPDSIIFQEFN